MTTYTIELCYESGRKVYIPLVAATDSRATKKMREYLQTNRCQLANVNAFLWFQRGFRRARDGQSGYLNQDGANPTGKAWK
jgi:hypothetical protein